MFNPNNAVTQTKQLITKKNQYYASKKELLFYISEGEGEKKRQREETWKRWTTRSSSCWNWSCSWWAIAEGKAGVKLKKEETKHVPNIMASLLVPRLLLHDDGEEEDDDGDSLVGIGEGMDCRQPNTTIISFNPEWIQLRSPSSLSHLRFSTPNSYPSHYNSSSLLRLDLRGQGWYWTEHI